MVNHIIPTLHTASTELTEIQSVHALDVFTFASDEQVAKTAVWDAHETVGGSIHYINQARSRFSIDPANFYLSWAVRELSSGKIVGLMSLTQLGGVRAQIAYVFHYKRWNTKIPAECIREVTHYALETFPEVERVQSRCFPTHQSSVQLLEQVGYQYEGISQAIVKVRGKLQDLCCFSMTRKRWSLTENSPITETYQDVHI